MPVNLVSRKFRMTLRNAPLIKKIEMSCKIPTLPMTTFNLLKPQKQLQKKSKIPTLARFTVIQTFAAKFFLLQMKNYKQLLGSCGRGRSRDAFKQRESKAIASSHKK